MPVQRLSSSRHQTLIIPQQESATKRELYPCASRHRDDDGRESLPMSLEARPLIWEPPAARELLHWPLPDQNRVNAFLVRAFAMLSRGRVLAVHGLHHVRPGLDPFILALNHTTRTEALLLPALIMLHRGGRLIHFLADWNFRLIPGIGLLYRRAQTITVLAKSARPRVLDALKPLYRQSRSTLDQARLYLAQGHSVGLFPEGTVNRDPHRLLAGRRSAALLSMETGAPIVPVGIRFPHAAPGRPIRDRDAMDVRIGSPLFGAPSGRAPLSRTALHERHAVIMTEIARLSGKTWAPNREGRDEAR